MKLSELFEDWDYTLVDDLIDLCESEDVDDMLDEIQRELDLTDDEIDALEESVRRQVSADGSVKKIKSRAHRKARATKTTGMSIAALKRRAKKAARTRSRSGSGVRKANRKRAKAMKRRKQRGLKSGS